MNLSQEEQADMLDQLSHDKAVELIPVSLYVFVMMAMGLCGNVLVCVFYCNKGRVTPTTRLIVAVAIIDTIICILMPKNIADLSLSYKFTSSALCKLNNFVNHTTAVSSAMVLVAIATFRFRAVCKPFSSQFSLRHANIAVAIAVAVSTLFSIPVLVTHESVPINITVSPNLTIVGYDCNTSKKPSLKPLNLFVNVLHFFIFISTTTTFLVLYGKMGVNIMKYYRTRKLLTGETATSVRSTSEYTSKSELDSGSSCQTEVHFREKNGKPSDIKSDELSTDTKIHSQHTPYTDEGLDNNGYGGEDTAKIDISLKEMETFDRENICKENHKSDCPETDDATDEGEEACNVNDKGEDDREVKHSHVTFDKEHTKSEDHVRDRPAKPGAKESNKISTVAVKQTIMLFIITVIFFLSFLPYLGMNIARTLSKNKDGNDDFTNWIQFCTRSYLINSAANPFVYGLFNSEFRNFVKRTLCRCCSK